MKATYALALVLVTTLTPAIHVQAATPITATGDDHIIAFLPNPNLIRHDLPIVGLRPMDEWGPSRLTLVAPSLNQVQISYNPSPSFGHHVVVTYHFDGRLSARTMDGSYTLTATQVDEWLYATPIDWDVGAPRNLVGTRVEGTWTIIEPWTYASAVGGVQLNVRGKTFDDVMPRTPQARAGVPSAAGVDAEWLPAFLVQQASLLGLVPPGGSEPIEGNGWGSWAADQGSRVKIWNWHEQYVPRYDVGLFTSSNLANPEQNPALRRFLVGPEAYLESPSEYATGADRFWAHIPPGGQAKVTAPDGATMTVEFQPAADLRLCNLGSSSGDPIAATGQSVNNCIAAAVALVGLGGNVISARQAHHPERAIPFGQIRVTGQLAGAPADGTWTIQPAIAQGGLPAGTRLSIGGRIFDDVHPDTEPIDGGGNAQLAGGLDAVRTWNHHMQSTPRYDTDPSSFSRAEEWVSYHRHLGFQVSDFLTFPAPVHENPVPDDLLRRVRPSYNDGIVEVWLDRDGDTIRDEGEAAGLDLNGVLRDPTGLVDGTALESFRPRLMPQSTASGANADTRVFRVVVLSFAPPHRVTVVTSGAYHTVADIVLYPLGTPDERHHLMLSTDPTPVDGSTYEVSLQMRTGCHSYHFEASGPVGWTRSPDQSVCV